MQNGHSTRQQQVKQFAHEAGQQINAGLIDRFNRRLHRMHWVVLVLGVAAGWGIDVVLNTILHSLTFFGGLGYVLDSLMGPIDETLVVIVPAISFKELVRRWWLRLRAKGWVRRADQYLFGAEPDEVSIDQTS